VKLGRLGALHHIACAGRDYWKLSAGQGIQAPAFEVLAKALEPWIDRFVR